VEQILDVGQAHGLEFVGGEHDLLEFVEGNAGGLEKVSRRVVGDATGAGWAGHGAGAAERGLESGACRRTKWA
jgi:hypothetical protein